MLFLPWRSEEQELLQIDSSEKFNVNLDSIFQNSKEFYFDRNIDDLVLEEMFREVENEQDGSSNEFQLAQLYRLEKEDYFEADEVEESHERKKVDNFLPPKLIPEQDYLNIMRSLNERQRCFVINVLHLYKTSENPYYFFLSGGAGVGKSHVITAIVQSVLRYNCRFPTEHPEDVCVIVSAPTGKAAFNVFGMTLHCTFKLPPNQSCGKLCDLDSSSLNSLRARLLNVKLFIVDEISMVSNRQLYIIDQRLRQIFANSLDFGGKPVIVVGDLRQLAPVAGSHVFKIPDHLPLGSCVGNHLWEKFSLYELKEIMRQKGDFEFCKALNNMAIGEMDSDDVKLIKSREVTVSNEPPQTAINLFSTNEECSEFNSKLHGKLQTEGALSLAFDRIQGTLLLLMISIIIYHLITSL